MSNIRNLKDLEKYLKNNPEIIFKQNIGKKIKEKCPICKITQEFKVVSEDRIKCLDCKEEFNTKIFIK